MLPYQQYHHDAMIAHNFEGKSPWPYMDTHSPAIITIGIGCATSAPEMLQLPFHLSSQDGPVASEQDILYGYKRVVGMKPGMDYRDYEYAGCLMLPDDAIETLVQKRYDSYAPYLHGTFGRFDQLAMLVQVGCLDLMWGLGPGSRKDRTGIWEYKNFIAAINSNPPDLITAAKESSERGKAYEQRNVWRASLFLTSQS